MNDCRSSRGRKRNALLTDRHHQWVAGGPGAERVGALRVCIIQNMQAAIAERAIGRELKNAGEWGSYLGMDHVCYRGELGSS